jgi:tight adherence protein C
MLWTIELFVFIAIFFLAYGVAVAQESRSKVKVRAGNLGSITAEEALGQLKKGSRLKEASVELLALSGQWALPNLDKVSEMRKSLIQAGFRHAKAPAVYLGLRVLTAFLLPLPLLLFYVMRGKMNASTLFIAMLMSIVGFYFPSFILGSKIRRRQDRLDKAVPDILDMFVISMDAGLSLNAALHRVANEIRFIFHDFFEELQIAAHELRSGINWDEAFDNLAKRTGVQSIRSMVNLMIQSGRLGGSVGDALRNHSEFTRTQRLLRAEEKAAKLPIKMVIPMIFCIFPAIVIVIVGPGLIHIFDKFLKGGFSLGVGAGKGFGGF